MRWCPRSVGAASRAALWVRLGSPDLPKQQAEEDLRWHVACKQNGPSFRDRQARTEDSLHHQPKGRKGPCRSRNPSRKRFIRNRFSQVETVQPPRKATSEPTTGRAIRRRRCFCWMIETHRTVGVILSLAGLPCLQNETSFTWAFPGRCTHWRYRHVEAAPGGPAR